MRVYVIARTRQEFCYHFKEGRNTFSYVPEGSPLDFLVGSGKGQKVILLPGAFMRRDIDAIIDYLKVIEADVWEINP
jgi:hypothetical protein